MMGIVLLHAVRVCVGEAFWTKEIHNGWLQVFSKMMAIMMPVIVANEMPGDVEFVSVLSCPATGAKAGDRNAAKCPASGAKGGGEKDKDKDKAVPAGDKAAAVTTNGVADANGAVVPSSATSIPAAAASSSAVSSPAVASGSDAAAAASSASPAVVVVSSPSAARVDNGESGGGGDPDRSFLHSAAGVGGRNSNSPRSYARSLIGNSGVSLEGQQQHPNQQYVHSQQQQYGNPLLNTNPLKSRSLVVSPSRRTPARDAAAAQVFDYRPRPDSALRIIGLDHAHVHAPLVSHKNAFTPTPPMASDSKSDSKSREAAAEAGIATQTQIVPTKPAVPEAKAATLAATLISSSSSSVASSTAAPVARSSTVRVSELPHSISKASSNTPPQGPLFMDPDEVDSTSPPAISNGMTATTAGQANTKSILKSRPSQQHIKQDANSTGPIHT
jgi:hypothetical protein